jgi:Ni/Co efflux regulator RcnB
VPFESSAAFAQSTGASDQAERENQARIEHRSQMSSPTQGSRRAEGIRGQPREQQRADQRSYRGEARGFDNRNANNRGYEYRNYGFRDGGYRGQGRGVGPGQSWYRGDRLPYQYRTRHYVVDDWRGHHLYAPPRGYQWVQSGGDYLLVAIATGLIASILLNQ